MVAAVQRGALRSSSSRLMRNGTDEDDLVSECLCRAFSPDARALRRAHADAWVRAWVAETFKRIGLENTPPTRASCGYSAGPRPSANGSLEELETHLDTLTSKQREAWRLVVDQRKSLSVAARQLGVDSSTLRERLTRAVKKLRHSVGPGQRDRIDGLDARRWAMSQVGKVEANTLVRYILDLHLGGASHRLIGKLVGRSRDAIRKLIGRRRRIRPPPPLG